jgi:hypothetical protein
VGCGLSAPPCLAAPPALPQANVGLRASVAKLAVPDTTTGARFTQEAGKDAASAATGESRSFIHSPKGIAAVILLVGGVAWAIASRSKDAVHSPGRK